jgi:hypothetical protein
MIKRECVDEERWVDEETFQRTLVVDVATTVLGAALQATVVERASWSLRVADRRRRGRLTPRRSVCPHGGQPVQAGDLQRTTGLGLAAEDDELTVPPREPPARAESRPISAPVTPSTAETSIATGPSCSRVVSWRSGSARRPRDRSAPPA